MISFLPKDRIRNAIGWRLASFINEEKPPSDHGLKYTQEAGDWMEINSLLRREKDGADKFIDEMLKPVKNNITRAVKWKLGFEQLLEDKPDEHGIQRVDATLQELWYEFRGYISASDKSLINLIDNATSWIMKLQQEQSSAKTRVGSPDQKDPTREVTQPTATAYQKPKTVVGLPTSSLQPEEKNEVPVLPVSKDRDPSESNFSSNNTRTSKRSETEKISDEDAIARESSEEVYRAGTKTEEEEKDSIQIREEGDDAQQLADEEELPPPPMPQWKYLPVPDGPDKHEEFDCRSLDTPEGLKLIGARVRGKKHKHDGTNCDDWFEFNTSSAWTLIAVSDGAGSKKFSRVGARKLCEEAIKSLSGDLKDHQIRERKKWSVDTFNRDEASGAFVEDDLEFVNRALRRAMHNAYDAMEKAAAERHNSVDHFEILNRRLTIDDLSATLLLAVHTTTLVSNSQVSLVFSCFVGDGMVAVIDKKGVARLLMTPDSGQYSGEVEFLTKKMIEPENLSSRIFPFLGNIRALLVMSDGVGDDYFPNDPGMLKLYGDLVLNQILNVRGPDEETIASALSNTNLSKLSDVEKAEFSTVAETITPDDPVQLSIKSSSMYAEKLGVSLPEVLASPALLVAGSIGEPMCDEIHPDRRLQVWLDSYKIRGSFDDRTLVVLYREEL